MQRLPNPNVALNSPDLAWTSCHEDDCKWQEATLAFQNAVVQVLWACGFLPESIIGNQGCLAVPRTAKLDKPLVGNTSRMAAVSVANLRRCHVCPC